jgi:hypothetical protein
MANRARWSLSPVKTSLLGLVPAAGAIAHAAAGPAPACGASLPSSEMTLLDAKIGQVEEVLGIPELSARGHHGGHAGPGFLLGDPPVCGWLSVEHGVVRSPTDPKFAMRHTVSGSRWASGWGERWSRRPRHRCGMEALRAHQALHASMEERELGAFIDGHSPAVEKGSPISPSTKSSQVNVKLE